MTAVSGNDQLLHCFYSNIFYSDFLFSLLVASSKAPEYEVFFFFRMATVSKDGTWKIWDIDGESVSLVCCCV